MNKLPGSFNKFACQGLNFKSQNFKDENTIWTTMCQVHLSFVFSFGGNFVCRWFFLLHAVQLFSWNMQMNPNFFDSAVLMIVIKTKTYISVCAPQTVCCGHGFFCCYLHFAHFSVLCKCTDYVCVPILRDICAAIIAISRCPHKSRVMFISIVLLQVLCGLVQ